MGSGQLQLQAADLARADLILLLRQGARYNSHHALLALGMTSPRLTDDLQSLQQTAW